MGDLNAVGIAQRVHEDMLKTAGCLNPEEHLRCRFPPPRAKTWEGLYIDDHLIVQILSRLDHVRGVPARDDELAAKARGAYDRHGFTRAPGK